MIFCSIIRILREGKGLSIGNKCPVALSPSFRVERSHLAPSLALTHDLSFRPSRSRTSLKKTDIKILREPSGVVIAVIIFQLSIACHCSSYRDCNTFGGSAEASPTNPSVTRSRCGLSSTSLSTRSSTNAPSQVLRTIQVADPSCCRSSNSKLRRSSRTSFNQRLIRFPISLIYRLLYVLRSVRDLSGRLARYCTSLELKRA